MSPARARPRPNSLASKLFDWLTLVDAAAYLSRELDEEVRESDVLRLGIDGLLQVSVRFANRAWARTGVLPGGEFEVDDLGNLELQWDSPAPIVIDGVWDLMSHVGAGEIELERELQRITGGDEIALGSFGGIFVTRPDRSLWAGLVTPDIPDVQTFPDIVVNGLPLVKVDWNCSPLHELPAGAKLVIRTDAMVAFLAALAAEDVAANEPKPPAKPSQTGTTHRRKAKAPAASTDSVAQTAAAARWAHLEDFKKAALEAAASKPFNSRAAAAEFAAGLLQPKPRPKARPDGPDKYYSALQVDEWLKEAGWVSA